MMPSSEPVQGGPPGAGDPGSPWQRPTIMVGGAPPRGPELPRRAPELDPQLAAMIGPPGSSGDSAPNKSMRSSARRVRSRLQLAVWVMIGAAVIGGGVFAGFQIRAMRLGRQITAARERAVDLARTDTWQGWIGARDALSSIVHASPTSDNEAALARSRGVLAYEFGDGAADAKAAIDGLAGQPSLDLDLAAGYLALAQSDGKTARELADRALHAAPDDPAALYISGQASLLAGDIKSAVADLRRALDRESRPLYAVALARALAASSAWDEALTTIDRGTDNPAAVIEKAFLVTGRAAAVPGNELRAQLAKLVAEGGKPAGEQARSVSPSQIAAAQLALAQVDFARSDTDAARTDSLAALAVGLNDQRFAELLSETLYAIGELDVARRSASRALETWPASRRARTTLAQVWLGLGKPAQALDLFAKDPEAASWAKGQTVRGQARLATGDLEGARADFDTALKKLPGYEPALIAGAWADLSTGSVGEAKQRIEPKFNPKSPTQAMAAVYAAILRATGEAAARTKAKALLERAAAGGPSPDALRVQLELARIDRELGDTAAARAAYAEAARSGNVDARFEGALYSIEAGDLGGARTAFEQLLGQAGQAGQSTQPGDHPSAAVMLETARARTLTGAHAEAAALLAAADEAPGVVRWQLDRERARIALRRDDTSGAAQALVRALDGCGADLETFLLAADTVAADATQTQLAARLKALVPVRLRGKPELEIIAGKLDLAATPRPRLDDAERHYNTARNALRRELATPRRRAQADYGIAAVAYAKSDDPTAGVMLELVHGEDPSIDPAYLFSAELIRLKDPRKALGFAQQAATYNPESLDAWKLIGTLAAQLGDRKLLTEAITRAGDLAPGSETLHELQKLR
jgi:tetratricopeptide (TPR) repeat protein